MSTKSDSQVTTPSRLCQPVPLADWPELVRQTVGEESPQRQQIVLATLKDVIQRGEADNLLLRRSVAEPSVGAIAMLGSQQTATVLAVGPTHNQPQQQKAAELLQSLHLELSERGVGFSQAMRDPEAAQPLLQRAGYSRLAVLDYLVGSRRPSAASSRSGTADNEALRFRPYGQFFSNRGRTVAAALNRKPNRNGKRNSPFAQLRQLVDHTYVDSLDCPRIAEFRTTDEVLKSYQQTPHHDPELWLVAVNQAGKAVGCLLLTAHPHGQMLEITYMALLPAFRGHGWGAQLLDQVWLQADRLGFSQLTLAVDQDNHPASQLYARSGFETLFSEAVWGRQLAKLHRLD